jgi:hypothetical protein
MQDIHKQLVEGVSYVRTVNAPYLLRRSGPLSFRLSLGCLKPLVYGCVQLDILLENMMGKYYGWAIIQSR